MDRQQVQRWEAQCIQEQPPACTATCPMHVDARGLIESTRNADFAGGFAILARSLPFPGIMSRICDHPCEPACKRGEVGDVVRIRALEQACTDYAYKAVSPPILPKKDKRVAIVGAGLSGLTAAVALAVKGYSVSVFEEKARLLDRLLGFDPAILPFSVLLADLAILEKLDVQIHTKTWISSGQCHALAEDFDAVYLGPGPEPLDPGAGIALRPNGHIAMDPLTFATTHAKIFAGGTHRYSPATFSPITSMHDGHCAALSIDRFLQGASLTANREKQGPYLSRLFVNTRGREHLSFIAAANPSRGYTKEEARQEAERCLPCQCLECVKACEYLAHYKSYPKRYVREIYNNDCIVMGQHPSNRMINTCSLCGLCEAVCPEKLSMGEVCLEARRSMVQKGKMPPSAHDFALRDMAFSRSEAFTLARHQPGYNSSAALFFPGCQLSASSPDHVQHTYEYLQTKIPGGVGLFLGCCGAPANWSGEDALYKDALRSVSDQWDELGRPRVITACSTCYRMFKGSLPELPVGSLWTIFDRHGLPSTAKPEPCTLAVHDPCTTRQEEAIQDSVRRITAKLGISIVELNERGQTTCCGYGGLMQFADALVAEKVVDRRVRQSDADYLTYCAMCRDNFARRSKRSLHILDLLFGASTADPAARPDPGFSVRQENRARLKTRLLREVWRETVAGEEKKLNLVIAPEVMASMERRMILVDDVQKVISHAEQTGEKIIRERGHFVASFRPTQVTYWVEYSVEGSAFVVHNAYSHRMEVG